MYLAWLSLLLWIWPGYHHVVNWHCCSLRWWPFIVQRWHCVALPCLPRWHLLFLISTTPCSKCILTFFLDLTKAKLPISLFLNLKICFYACDICWIIWKILTLKESESENPNIVLSCLPWMAFIVLGASQHAPKMHLASSLPHCFPLHYFLM